MEENNTNKNPNTIKDEKYIDNELEKWYKAIEKAAQETIPTTKIKILPYPINSELLKQLQWQFDNLKKPSTYWVGQCTEGKNIENYKSK